MSEIRLKRTFRRKALESQFLEFCQLSVEAFDVQPSRAEFHQTLREAQNFIDNDDFGKRTAEGAILGDTLLDSCGTLGAKRSPSKRVSLPPHLAGLTETRLLTPEQEVFLFRRTKLPSLSRSANPGRRRRRKHRSMDS